MLAAIDGVVASFETDGVEMFDGGVKGGEGRSVICELQCGYTQVVSKLPNLRVVKLTGKVDKDRA